MPRRGENIHKRADGRWEGRLQTGIDGATGKSHFKSVYATTYKEAKAKLTKLKRDLENGLIIEGNSLTIRSWVEKWLNDYKRGQVEPTTFENYRYSVKHIYKHLGQHKLKDLRPDHIQAFINTLGADGHNRVLKISHTLLAAALEQAVKNDMLLKNPAKATVLPKQARKEAKVLSVEEQQLFLAALKGERLASLFMFQMATGMRPGEATAVTWADVDMEAGLLIINKAIRRQKDPESGKTQLVVAPTKTKKARIVELLPEAIEVLRQQRRVQAAERLKAGSAWQDNGFVFSTALGTPLDRDNFDKVLRRVKARMRELAAEKQGIAPEEVKLTDLTAHTLRHTFATRALEMDIPLKIVAEWLGHSTIRVTGDIYSHALPEKKRDSMEKLKGKLIGLG